MICGRHKCVAAETERGPRDTNPENIETIYSTEKERKIGRKKRRMVGSEKSNHLDKKRKIYISLSIEKNERVF